MTNDRRIRPGSRLLLGIALFAGILMSMCGGALIADFALDLLGVASPPVRLGVKGFAMAAALPAGFYLVERAFLARSSRYIPENTSALTRVITISNTSPA